MELALDATPLIHLTRAGFWKHYGEHGTKLITTPSVVEELQLDETAHPEAHALRGMLSAGQIMVIGPKMKIPAVRGLSDTDVSIETLAKERNAIAVIDERLATAYAKALGVKTIHSTALIINAVRERHLDKTKAINILDEMVAGGWHCGTGAYANIRNAISEA